MRTSPEWLLKMAGDCARPHQYLLASTHDRVTIAPGTAFFSESEVAKQREKREMMAGLLNGQDYRSKVSAP